MDVVRRNIKELGGSIEVRSTLGRARASSSRCR
jgi:chemotaxis protein histidine kinase CheA